MNVLPERSQIPEEMKWNLEDIFASEALWEKGYQDLIRKIERLRSFKGRLHESATLLEALEFSVETEKLAEKIYAFARMHRDEDNSSNTSQAMAARALTAFLRIEEEASYMAPELLAIPQNVFVGFFDQTPGLKQYKRHLMEILRKRKYVLTQNEEHILSLTSEMSNGFRDAFTMLNNADMRFGTVQVDNEEVEITHGRYGWLLRHPQRRVREDTFDTYYYQYERHKNTISALLSGALKADLFYTRARGYASTMEASLYDDNVPTSVYHRLIDAANQRIGSMHRYITMKKETFSLDKVHFYDLYAPMTKDVNIRMDYGQACNIVKEALSPLGEEYAAQLDESFAGRWIDVSENRGKTSGAYSWGVYGVHPYVLLNWQDNLDNAFTLAHELGHAMHSHNANASQPYIDAQYKILTAEVASTVNEALLMAHLIRKAQNNVEKAMLLNHYLENFRTTFFRQIMFAEFEANIHQAVQNNVPLTAEKFGEDYLKLNLIYHGRDMELDPQIALECLRIPHFYSSFYVYKYATGFASAVAISKAILEGEHGAKERYLDFLRSGGSDYPLELLKKAGVDLTTDEPVMRCIDVFDETLSELESIQ